MDIYINSDAGSSFSLFLKDFFWFCIKYFSFLWYIERKKYLCDVSVLSAHIFW